MKTLLVVLLLTFVACACPNPQKYIAELEITSGLGIKDTITTIRYCCSPMEFHLVGDALHSSVGGSCQTIATDVKAISIISLIQGEHLITGK